MAIPFKILSFTDHLFIKDIGICITKFIKGQLISKGHFGVFKSTKQTNEIFVRISAIAYQKFYYTK